MKAIYNSNENIETISTHLDNINFNNIDSVNMGTNTDSDGCKYHFPSSTNTCTVTKTQKKTGTEFDYIGYKFHTKVDATYVYVTLNLRNKDVAHPKVDFTVDYTVACKTNFDFNYERKVCVPLSSHDLQV